VRRKKRTKRSPKGALVNEVTKRVTQRLLAESKREKRSDEIAENVIKRIQALKRS
jgi:transcriptional regulator NrdR family protein